MNMRGKPQAQPDFLTVINLNACVPADHPLRSIKMRMDAVLKQLGPLFDELYEKTGRPSIPPEQLLKARVLTALYSVRSERLFCEQLSYNLLWLWFLDREFSEGSFDHSIFAKNYERVLSAEVAKLFFAEIYDLSRQEGWTSDEHFTADGTLIESWASLKSFVRKDGTDQEKVRRAKDDDPGNPTIGFHGEKRCNDTHQSSTDPQSVLYRKAKGKEARLCYGGHILMENRQGLCADFAIHNPITEAEPLMALRQLDEHSQLHEGTRPKTIGTDKAYFQKALSADAATAVSRLMPPAKTGCGFRDWMAGPWPSPDTRSVCGYASGSRKSLAGSKRSVGCDARAIADANELKLGPTLWRAPITCCEWRGWN
jgi:transposase